MKPANADLDWIDASFPHRLLEMPQQAYSDATVRRAFIVWLHCGHQNVFRDVCNYYHRLAGLEDELPADRRASSRHQEFQLFYNRPPSSIYLTNHFPKLYSQSHINNNYIKRIEAIKNEYNVFNIEGFNDMKDDTGVTKQEIILVSRMIRNFCKERQMVLRKFLVQFRAYTQICRIKQNIQNVKRFIRSKAIQAEILLEANIPTDFSFLHDENVKEKEDTTKRSTVKTKSVDIDKPLRNGNRTLSNFHGSQMKLMSAVAVKTAKVKILEASDDEKENRTNKSSVDSTGFNKAVEGNDKNSATVDNRVNSKSSDNAAASVKVLKRNGNDTSLKIMNSAIQQNNFVKNGTTRSRRLSWH